MSDTKLELVPPRSRLTDEEVRRELTHIRELCAELVPRLQELSESLGVLGVPFPLSALLDEMTHCVKLQAVPPPPPPPTTDDTLVPALLASLAELEEQK